MILDAQQVLNTLGLLDTGFENFGKRLASTTAIIENFNKSGYELPLQRLGESAAKAASEMPRLAAGISEVARNSRLAQEQTNHWVLSWETLTRIVQTQALLRSYNMIRDAITESYEAQLKFAKQVSEIHAVDPSRGFGAIAASVRQMSDVFNQPISDVAEATYQAISNQFVNASDQSKLLTAANDLAKVSCQELGTAGQLLPAPSTLTASRPIRRLCGRPNSIKPSLAATSAWPIWRPQWAECRPSGTSWA